MLDVGNEYLASHWQESARRNNSKSSPTKLLVLSSRSPSRFDVEIISDHPTNCMQHVGMQINYLFIFVI